jgi:hypothetical protein
MAKKTVSRKKRAPQRSVAIGTWPTPEKPVRNKTRRGGVATRQTRRRAPSKKTANPRGIDTVPIPDKPVPKKARKTTRKKVAKKQIKKRTPRKKATKPRGIDTVPLPDKPVPKKARKTTRKKVAKKQIKKRTPRKKATKPRGIDTVPLPDKPVPKKTKKPTKRSIGRKQTRRTSAVKKTRKGTRKKMIKVTKESRSGRNERFRDPSKRGDMSRAEFVKGIEQGKYPGYHIRKVRGIKTPVSNPDGRTGNNLG